MTGTEYLQTGAIRTFIDRALKEDMAEGDQSTLAAIPYNAKARARLLFKDDGLVAGLELGEKIFNRVDKSLHFQAKVKDGDIISRGQTGFFVDGSARSILSADILVLNCLQRMSGIATKTRKMVALDM